MKRPYNVRFWASLSGFLHDSGIHDAKLPLWSQIQLCQSGACTSVRLFLTPDYVKSPLPLAQRKKGTPHKTGSRRRPAEPNVTVAYERRQDMYAHDWHKHTRKDMYHPPCATWLHVGQVWRKHIFFILGVAFGFASASIWRNLPLSRLPQANMSLKWVTARPFSGYVVSFILEPCPAQDARLETNGQWLKGLRKANPFRLEWPLFSTLFFISYLLYVYIYTYIYIYI